MILILFAEREHPDALRCKYGELQVRVLVFDLRSRARVHALDVVEVAHAGGTVLLRRGAFERRRGLLPAVGGAEASVDGRDDGSGRELRTGEGGREALSVHAVLGLELARVSKRHRHVLHAAGFVESFNVVDRASDGREAPARLGSGESHRCLADRGTLQIGYILSFPHFPIV